MEYQLKFFEEVFIPFLKKNRINTVLQTGDLFDKRKYTSHSILHVWKRRVFDVLQKMKVEFHVVVGNHDAAFSNTVSVNSPSLLLSNYENIIVYSEPTEVMFDKTPVLMVPWVCKDNEKPCLEAIKESTSFYCMGHFELGGFEMQKGTVIDSGLDKSKLDRFCQVWSGHYHTRSNDGRIYYLGTPYELTWADYNDQRGFYTFDTSTLDFDFHKNPHVLFNKIHYNDSIGTSKGYHKGFDLSGLENTYVKVIVTKKTDAYEFDALMDKMYKMNIADIKIIDDFNDDATEVDDDDVELGDTMTLANTYIDSSALDLDKPKLKSLMLSLHVEALSFEG